MLLVAHDAHTVRVSEHALVRWRLRSARPGDGSEAGLIRALRGADEVPWRELPRVLRRHWRIGSRYFRHRPTGAYLVCEHESPGCLVVLSVVVPYLEES